MCAANRYVKKKKKPKILHSILYSRLRKMSKNATYSYTRINEYLQNRQHNGCFVDLHIICGIKLYKRSVIFVKRLGEKK